MDMIYHQQTWIWNEQYEDQKLPIANKIWTAVNEKLIHNPIIVSKYWCWKCKHFICHELTIENTAYYT